jgi:hypothetical protein
MRPARTSVSVPARAALEPLLDSSHARPLARPMRRVTACLVLLRSWEELARTTSEERELPGRAWAGPRWSVCSMVGESRGVGQGCDGAGGACSRAVWWQGNPIAIARAARWLSLGGRAGQMLARWRAPRGACHLLRRSYCVVGALGRTAVCSARSGPTSRQARAARWRDRDGHRRSRCAAQTAAATTGMAKDLRPIPHATPRRAR